MKNWINFHAERKIVKTERNSDRNLEKVKKTRRDKTCSFCFIAHQHNITIPLLEGLATVY